MARLGNTVLDLVRIALATWVLALVGNGDPAVGGQDGPTSEGVACSACNGSGRLVRDCWVCEDGEHRCPHCARFAPSPPSRWSPAWVPRAAVEAVLERGREIAKELERRGFDTVGGGGGRVPDAADPRPGELLCPARCRGGQLLLIQQWVDCQLCRSGKFRCVLCARGRLDCRRCEGRGEAEDACDDCAGTGRVPDPSSLSPDTCPWCAGSSRRACGSCDEAGEVREPCLTCFGLQRVACPRCAGVRERACEQCGGRGRYGPGKLPCDPCRRKGVLPCDACEDGTASCSTCRTRTAVAIPCPHCSGAKEHPCNGCEHGAYLAWERTAVGLAAAGDAAAAATWLTAARERCERRYEAAVDVEAVFGPDAPVPDPRGVEREKKEELRRLELLGRELRE